MFKKFLVEVKVWTDNIFVIENTIDYLNCNVDESRICKATIIEDKVLEKEIPKQVIKTKNVSQACPICKKAVNWNYCSNCGQKLGW